MVRRASRNEEYNDGIPLGLSHHAPFFLVHRGGFRDYDCELGTRNPLLEEF